MSLDSIFLDSQVDMAHSAPAAMVWKRPVKTALHQAVLDGRIHQVRLLVNKHKVNVDCKDMFGRTPLMLACLLDSEEHGLKMVRIFLRAAAFVNVRDNMNRTALSYACMKGKVTIVKQLLREELVDVHAPDNDGNTCLCHAALSASPQIISLMTAVYTKFGLETDARNAAGYTPLLLACKYGHYVSAHTLMKDGKSSPSLRDNEFFLNALDWVLRSDGLKSVFTGQYKRHFNKPLTTGHASQSAAASPRFAREQTIYGVGGECSITAGVPECKHYSVESHPLGQSLDSAMRLPAIFSNFHVDKPQEMIIDGADAKLIVIREIEDALRNPTGPRLRTTSRVNSLLGRTVLPGSNQLPPSTPKLLAITKRRTNTQHDLTSLFQMYAEQYRAPIEKEPSQRPATTNKSVVSILKVSATTKKSLLLTPDVTVHRYTPENCSQAPTVNV